MALRKHHVGAWSLLAAMALLGACQAPLPLGAPSSFAIGSEPSGKAPLQSTESAPVPVAAHHSTPAEPVAPTAATAPARSSGGGSRSPRSGTVEVDVAKTFGDLVPAAQRRLLATTDDVARIVVTLSDGWWQDRIQTVTYDQLRAGQTTVTFKNVMATKVTITVTAYDAAGTVIGTVSEETPVVWGDEHDVSLAVPIDPDIEAVPPASGAVYVPDAGTVLASFKTPAFWGPLYVDDAGHYYVYSRQAVTSFHYTWVHRFHTSDGGLDNSFVVAASGQPLIYIGPVLYDNANDLTWFGGVFVTIDATGEHRTLGELRGTAMARGADGAVYLATRDKVVSSADGLVSSETPMLSSGGLEVDPAGHFWTTWQDTAASPEVDSLIRYDADQNELARYALPFAAIRVHADTAGNMWVSNIPRYSWIGETEGTGDRKLVHVAADGTVGAPLTVEAEDFCVAPTGEAWLISETTLTEMAPDGTVLATYPIGGRTVAWGEGAVWVGSDTSVTKVAP